ncbi:LacI family DNA-binding transcriptional regulator [Alteromonas sp. a30]|uniref:LacI family DNA-binding transcriptional regulator n=1 Tax=Alteromonas sp. a30 TaxID=2730917 RepID=UPI00227FCB46|nr:LacI family DNA-binding transcriptional regulator [Alteromonas sp. a30]MCY7294676.1 LacI family DNA-binding transcriptional regulator [Alteromonas sp. a30]
MRKKVSTLSDMAKLAGVSESTVSRALSNSKLISVKTRERIQALAKEANFSVNTTARNLRLQKSNTIAVVLLIHSENDQSTTDPFILRLLGVIADELTRIGYDMLLASHTSPNENALKNYFDSKKADGMIVFGQGNDPALFDHLLNNDMPFVVWGTKDPHQRYLTVGTDNFLGGKLATEHLINQGCKHIAYAGRKTIETELRFHGYQDALEKADLPSSPLIDIHFTYQDGYNVATKLLETQQFNFDGIVAASDTIALGILKAFNDFNAEKELSEQAKPFSIVGYDDIEVSKFMHPSLTTIRQDTYEGGKRLVELLFKQIHKKPAHSVELETKLIERGSSKLV